MVYEHILIEKDEAIGVLTMNRPRQLNALSFNLIKEMCLALEDFDQEWNVFL